MAAQNGNPISPPATGNKNLLSVLQGQILSGKLDVGTALWQAASSGSVETLDLVLMLPNGGIIIAYYLASCIV